MSFVIIIVVFYCPCKQYNGEFLPDILMLTYAPVVVWLDDIIIVPGILLLYLFNYYVLDCLLVLVAFGGLVGRLM